MCKCMQTVHSVEHLIEHIRKSIHLFQMILGYAQGMLQPFVTDDKMLRTVENYEQQIWNDGRVQTWCVTKEAI